MSDQSFIQDEATKSPDKQDAAPDSGDGTADEGVDTGQEDHHSPSPAPQGASRTTGGVFRGHARGNAFKPGDAVLDDLMPLPLMGRIVLYDKSAANAEPLCVTRQPVAADLKSVLSSLAEKFSPIRSRFCSLTS